MSVGTTASSALRNFAASYLSPSPCRTAVTSDARKHFGDFTDNLVDLFMPSTRCARLLSLLLPPYFYIPHIAATCSTGFSFDSYPSGIAAHNARWPDARVTFRTRVEIPEKHIV